MAKLTVIEGPDTGTEFEIPEEPGAVLSIGRDPRNTVVLNDVSVSREHLRIEFDGRDFRLVDLGSKNRTYLNSEPVRESLLRSGDRIGLGDSELRFEAARAASDGRGVESTIMKELPALEGAGLSGVIQAVGPGEDFGADALGQARHLLGLSQTLGRCRSLEDLHRELLAVLVPALKGARGAVLVRSGKRWAPSAVHPGAGHPGTPAGGETAIPPEAVIRRVAEEARAVLSVEGGGGGGSLLAAPLTAGRSGDGSAPVAAVLAVERTAPPPFGEDDLRLLAAACEQASDLACHLHEEARLREENRILLRSLADSKRVVGTSKAIARVLDFVRRAAPAHQTVLIRGETGTGKELVAQAIHYASPRQGKPCQPVNCAAIPENLIESELFGHERGAYTGAVARRKGKFELADGGTVFLDEVGDLPLPCQAKLLRFLEDRRFERLGGSEVVEVDVRVIAATNKDLARAISQGQFREDLFYRLNVLGITLPALRERKEDIPVLAEHFLDEVGAGNRRIGPEAMEKLMAFSWPGNVRQLKNVIERAVVLGEGPEIRPQDLILPGPEGASPAGEAWEPLSLEELGRRHIIRVLEHTGGNKKRAAEILGIERCTLYAKLKGMGIGASTDSERNEGEGRPGADSEKDGRR